MNIGVSIKFIAVLAILTFVGATAVCKRPEFQTILPRIAADSEQNKWANEPILPIPTDHRIDARKAALGEKLFNDARLSNDNSISCASCHNLDEGGADQAAFSNGIHGQRTSVNSPTVFNSSLNFKQFWDGRADTLESQVAGPIHAPNEMGSNWDEIIAKLNQSIEYQSEFKAIYDAGIRPENIQDAIASFERTLVTPNSRFDQFLRGDQEILTKAEKEGYKTFKSVGCISCHQGVNVGGNLFQEFGVLGNYFADRGNITTADLGRFNITHQEHDRHVFKVPGLRNVSRTFPYFHDGSAKTLEEAVLVMSKYQLGRELSAPEIDLIVAFLKTLDGEYKRYDQ